MGKASRRAERMGEGANPAENRRARWLNLHCGSLCTVAHFARWLTLRGGLIVAMAKGARWGSYVVFFFSFVLACEGAGCSRKRMVCVSQSISSTMAIDSRW